MMPQTEMLDSYVEETEARDRSAFARIFAKLSSSNIPKNATEISIELPTIRTSTEDITSDITTSHSANTSNTFPIYQPPSRREYTNPEIHKLLDNFDKILENITREMSESPMYN